jgi:hypothetical protein
MSSSPTGYMATVPSAGTSFVLEGIVVHLRPVSRGLAGENGVQGFTMRLVLT